MIKLPMAELEKVMIEARIVRGRVLLSEVDGSGEIKRNCGTCTECCDCLAIQTSANEVICSDVETTEFAKPSGSKCAHADKGCSIYSHRPLSCRGYACLWALGHGPNEHRPDKTGVLVDDYMDAAPLKLQLEIAGPVPICFATECAPGVFPHKSPETPESAYPQVVQDLAKDRVVMLRWYGDGHPEIMIGPKRLTMVVNFVDAEWARRGM